MSGPFVRAAVQKAVLWAAGFVVHNNKNILGSKGWVLPPHVQQLDQPSAAPEQSSRTP